MFCFASSASNCCATAQVWMHLSARGSCWWHQYIPVSILQMSSMWSLECKGLVLVLVVTRRLSQARGLSHSP